MCRKCSRAGQARSWPEKDRAVVLTGCAPQHGVILIKSTFAQSFIAQQVIRLSATQRVRQSASPHLKKGRLMPFYGDTNWEFLM